MKYVVRVRDGHYYNIGKSGEFVADKADAMQFGGVEEAREWADHLNNSVRFPEQAVFVIEPMEG